MRQPVQGMRACLSFLLYEMGIKQVQRVTVRIIEANKYNKHFGAWDPVRAQ